MQQAQPPKHNVYELTYEADPDGKVVTACIPSVLGSMRKAVTKDEARRLVISLVYAQVADDIRYKDRDPFETHEFREKGDPGKP